MKKKHYLNLYVIINIATFATHVTKSKSKVADITGISRTTIANVTERYCNNGFIIIPAQEE